MAVNLNEVRQKRAELVTGARALLDRADAEKRELTAEENEQYDRHHAEIRKMAAQIAREQEQAALEDEIKSPQVRGVRATPEGETAPRLGEYRTRHNETIKLRGSTEALRRAAPDYGTGWDYWLRSGFRGMGATELRALQADADIAGGYLVPPQQYVADLIQAVDNVVFVRQLATKFPLMSAETMGVPALDTDPDDADWTSEIVAAAEDSSMAFGKRQLQPHPLSKLIKVSNKLLRQSAIDVEALTRQRLAYKFGIPQEKNFLTGNGTNQPLGVFTASTQGITTARDISTGNTTTAIQVDGLQAAKWGLKPQYRSRPTTRWMFHTDALAQISKLKDGDGQYIWQQGLVASAPDRLLSLPYMESLYAPNTFTTGLYVGILGDWSYYWIADSLALTIQRLDELYAVTNQAGFIGRLECDGMPVLAEAFVRVKLA